MGPIIIVLLAALAVFWYLGLLTPKRLNIIAGVGGILIGLFIAAKGQYFLGLPLMGAGGFLAWRGLRGERGETGAMTLKEAAKILRVKEGASVDEIRAAHRLAIASAHPDKGGSDAESARINEARDLMIASRMKDG